MRDPILRWVLTALTALVAGLWLASAWKCAAWRSSTSDSIAFVLKGRFEVFVSKPQPPGFKVLGPPPPGLSAGGASRLWMWDQNWQWVPRLRMGPFGVHAIVPLWMVFVATATPAAMLWRGRLRRGRFSCASCGYDLRGLAGEAVCPECGERGMPVGRERGRR